MHRTRLQGFAPEFIRGFTLIELMVTIAIVAILAAIAFPSFRYTLRNNRAATATNDLMASFSLARSEAVRSARGSGICTSTDGVNCGGTWDDGWMVWINNDADTAPGGANDRVVRYTQAHSQLSVTATSSGGRTDLVMFDPRGRVADGNDRDIIIRPSSCTAGEALQRHLTLGRTGQTRIAREDCP